MISCCMDYKIEIPMMEKRQKMNILRNGSGNKEIALICVLAILMSAMPIPSVFAESISVSSSDGQSSVSGNGSVSSGNGSVSPGDENVSSGDGAQNPDDIGVAAVEIDDHDAIEYGNNNEKISAKISDGENVISGAVTYAIVSGGDVVSGNDIVDIDVFTGRVTPKKAGIFTVRASYAGDDKYGAASSDREFEITRKTLDAVLADSNVVIEKISDDTTDLTENNKNTIKELVTLVKEQVVEGDRVELAVEVPDAIGYATTRVFIGEGEMNNSIALDALQITLKEDEGKYQLQTDAVTKASLKAKIIPAVPDDSVIDMSAARADVCLENSKVVFVKGILGTDGKYWYNADGVQVVLPDDNTDLVADASDKSVLKLLEGNTYLALSDGESFFVKQGNKYYGPYQLVFRKDTTAPSIILCSVKNQDGDDAGNVVFDKTAVYTIQVTDAGSGVVPRGSGGIMYGITDENNVDAVTQWREPESLMEFMGENGVGTYTFNVEVKGNGYLFVKATDCVGNVEESSAFRTVVLEEEAPAMELTWDGDEYAKTHEVNVTARDAEEEGRFPYTYSGIARIEYVLKKNGAVVFYQSNGADIPDGLSQLPTVRTMNDSITLEQGNVGEYTGKKLNGIYLLTVTTYDNCGNSISDSCTLYFDNAAPDCSITMMGGAQDMEGNYYYNAGNCGLKIMINDTRIMDGVVYQVQIAAGTTVRDTKSGLLTESGMIIYTADEMNKFADGKLDVTISLMDSSGNTNTRFTNIVNMNGSENSTTASFYLDTEAPKARVEMEGGNALDNTYYYKADNCGINVIFTDNLGNGSVPARGGRAEYTASIGSTAGNILEYSLAGNETVIRAGSDSVKTCGDGVNIITVTATDVAGNTMTSLVTVSDGDGWSRGVVIDGSSAEFTLDTVPPELKSAGIVEIDPGKGGPAYYSNDADNVYLNCGYTVSFVVEEDNYCTDYVVAEAAEVILADEENKATWVYNVVDPGLITLTAETQDRHIDNAGYLPSLTVRDKAGNYMCLAPDFDNSGHDYNNVTVVDGKATMKVCQVLDNVAPVLKSVKLEKENGEDIPAYTDKVYLNSAYTVTYEVAEENYSNMDGLVLLGAEGVHKTAPVYDSEDKARITMDIRPGEDKSIEGDSYVPYLQMRDKAGNVIEKAEDFTNYGNIINNVTVAGGKAVMDIEQVLDTRAPEVTIRYTEPGESHYYTEGDAAYVYYNKRNKNLTAAYTVNEANFDSNKIYIGYSVDGADVSYRKIAANADKIEEPDALIVAVEDNVDSTHYQFAVYGEDKAGNKVTVIDNQAVLSASGQPDSVTAEECGEENKYISASHKIIDTVAPVYTLQIESPGSSNKKLNSEYGNRFYFNSAFTATVEVKETNYDKERIIVNRAFEGCSNDRDSLTVDMSAQGCFTDRIQGNGPVYKDKVDRGDGVYRYQIYGTDRAGNILKAAAGSDVLSDILAVQGRNGETESDLSVHVVLDTVKPEIDVHIRERNTAGMYGEEFYVGRLTREGRYEQSINMPYRSSSRAEAKITGMDYSPISLSYLLESDNTVVNNKNTVYEGGRFLVNASQTAVLEGQQAVRITKLTATDLAGNTSIAPASYNGAVGTKIYLDIKAPDADEFAPSVKMELSGPGAGGLSKGTVYGTDGLLLYTGNVAARVRIEDPGRQSSSSGLYKVYYKVEVAGQDWTDRNLIEITSNTDSGIVPDVASGVIYYHTAGAGTVVTAEETLTYRDDLIFTFNAADFNYNDVRLTVWAEDNSGNRIQEANYISRGFGIDTTPPVIKVVYDNNEAQNEKYFQADRTATIVVTERNFNEAQTQIFTEQDAVKGGWTHISGSAANGDTDTWVCKVIYNVDGDYTFDVTTADLAGNKMNAGVDYEGSNAPREFVIDKTVPVIHITFDNEDVRNGKYYNAGRMATIDITEHNFGAEGAGVKVTADIAEGTVDTPAVSGWSVNEDSNIAGIDFTEDGDYTITVEYMDLAGNQAETVTVEEFTIDTTAPVIEIGGVEDHSANQGEVAPAVTYHDINYAPDMTVVSITGYKNKEGKNLSGTAEENSFGGRFSCTNIEQIPENDDVYRCTGHVEDLAGNISEAELSFSVNRFGSNYILGDTTEELVEGYYTNKPTEIHVTEINVNTLEFQEITATMNGEILDLQRGRDYEVSQSGDEGSWKEYQYTIPAEYFETDGAYNITIHSRDEARNENSNRTAKVQEYSKPIDFVLDTTAPTVVISGVEENAQYVEDSRIITLIAEDNIRLEELELYLDGNLVAAYGEEELAQSDGTVTWLAASRNNWQNFEVIAKDKAGNRTQSTGVRFLLTSNLFIQYTHNTPAVLGTVAAVICFVGIIVILLWRRKEKDKEQE